MKKALFLDRDGVICKMVFDHELGLYDSPQRVIDVSLVPGIEKVINLIKEKGYFIIEASNQPGVAKGKITKEISDAIEARVHQLLREKGVKIDGKYICHHHPRGIVPNLTIKCNCRKPKPGLLLQAAREFNIDLEKSIFLGDNASDVEAGKNAGCRTIIYLHGGDTPEKVEKAEIVDADYKVYTIKEVILILKQFFAI